MPFSNWKIVAGIVVLCAIAGTLFATRHFPSDGTAIQLRVLANEGGVSMRSDAAYGTFFLGSTCVSSAGEVKILSVEPLQSVGGGEISDVSAFPFSQLGGRAGADLKRLRSLPQFKGSRMVSEVCPKHGAVETQLAVEIHNPSKQDAVVRGLQFRYESGGKVRAVEVPLVVGLCRSSNPCE